ILTYGEQFGSGGFGFGRYWIATGGTVTFTVQNGSATYRVSGATLAPDPGFGSNTAAGTFTMDATGTVSPF
ncbi:MAG: hypothetical protein M3N19_00705, partial [Candidatus Eremiobacteraeota bacterium]|nr:hypothetical protein [Candidatus Eremiobacteraeota bacterium]